MLRNPSTVREPSPAGLGNDPVMTCDPLGMPRNLFLEVSIYPMEIVQTPKRVFQFFEWAHAWREIWTDGRALPKDPGAPLDGILRRDDGKATSSS